MRGVLAASVENTALREGYVNVASLPADSDYRAYQAIVNPDLNAAPSHRVIQENIARNGLDYRFETQPSPIEALRDRKADNTSVGRIPEPALSGTR